MFITSETRMSTNCCGIQHCTVKFLWLSCCKQNVICKQKVILKTYRSSKWTNQEGLFFKQRKDWFYFVTYILFVDIQLDTADQETEQLEATENNDGGYF